MKTVSILTDSWESVQQATIHGFFPILDLFQSSPTPGSRCNEVDHVVI